MSKAFKAHLLRRVFVSCALLIVVFSVPVTNAQVVLGEDISQHGRILTVGASESATQNATDLNNALGDTAGLSPTVDSPVVIELGPGLFDFGTTSTAITMPDHVHLRGAGAKLSILKCNCSLPVISASGTTNQFSHLTVENTGASGNAIIAQSGATIGIHHAMTVAHRGVLIDGAATTAEITRSTLLSTDVTGEDALQVTNGAQVTVKRSQIDGPDSSNDGVVWGTGASSRVEISDSFIGQYGVQDPFPGTAACLNITRPRGESVSNGCHTPALHLSNSLKQICLSLTALSVSPLPPFCVITPGIPIAFVTSEDTDGNLGGLAGADDDCNRLATAAGLPGTYKAWLSTSTVDAKDRFPTNGKWQDTRGNIVITDLDLALVGGAIAAPIQFDELAGGPLNSFVWTGTTASGVLSLCNCTDWSTNVMSSVCPGPGRAAAGVSSFSNSNWTQALADNCDKSSNHRLYCLGL